MERGKYTVYGQERTPRLKKTIRMFGSFEERNRFIKCWNCGYTVDTEQDLGSAFDTGERPIRVYVPPTPAWGSGDSKKIMLKSTGHTVMRKLTADGTPQSTYKAVYLPTVDRGCPLCGTTNL